MPRLTEDHDHFILRRDFSPDRRLALDWLPFPDPRSQWELEHPDSVELRDAETGAVLARFGGWAMIEDHDWPAAGGIALRLMRDVRIVIAPDLATFTTGDDPETARPIAALQDWLRTLIPPTALGPPPTPLLERVALWGGLIAVLALVLFGISRLPPVKELIDWATGTAEAERGTGGITGWIVRCPDIGPVNMSLGADGRLRVPIRVAPAPLPPIDASGRRFGDGRVAVAVDGLDVTWWPDGLTGAPVLCPTRIEGH